MIPPGLKQLLKLLRMRIRKELCLLGYKRKERRWDETPWPFLRAIRAGL